jgi:hypothetical protein
VISTRDQQRAASTAARFSCPERRALPAIFDAQPELLSAGITMRS